MQEKIELILQEIKKKQELKNLDDGFILNQINDQLSLPKNKKIEKKIKSQPINHLLKSKEVKELIKAIRAQARLSYGMFKTSQSKLIRSLLEELQQILKNHPLNSEESLQVHNKLLKTHKSTYERGNIYPDLYQKLFEKSMTPQSILDLGCGINPISQIFMKLKNLEYHAREFSQEDCNELQEYYNIVNLKGTIQKADLTQEQEYSEVDIVFLFKVLDVIEHQKRGVTKYLLTSLNTKYIIASFATQSLGGKPMKSQRNWFLNIVEELGYEIKTHEINNEMFYLIKKN